MKLSVAKLYQWDIGVEVSGFTGNAVQFANQGDSQAVTIRLDGEKRKRIPDRYLTTGKPLVVYDVTVSDNSDVTETHSVTIFPVAAKPKPKNYAPTEAEKAFSLVENLVNEAKKAAKSSENLAQNAAGYAEDAYHEASNANASAGRAEEAAAQVDSNLIDIKTGYDGTVYDTAGDAVRGQVRDIESAFDFENIKGNNIIDPSNSELGAFSETAANLVVGNELVPIAHTGRWRSTEAISIPSGTRYLYLRTIMETEGDTSAIVVYFLDEQKGYIKKFATKFGSIIAADNGSLKSDSVPANCSYIHVVVSGATSGHDFSKLCISCEPIASFEEYKVTRKRTLKETVLPKKIAPTSNMKMLVFGDSITETAKMDNDGGNYNPNYKMNWPVVAQEILQLSDVRNYAKAGATARDTGYERNEQGELVPKNETVLYRMNLSEQVDLALSDTHYTDTPDIIVISIGTNDSAAIEGKPDESRDTYEEAMAIASLDDFTYETRSTMHKALRYAMWKLKVAYPFANCFIATPLQREAFEIPKYTRDAISAMGNRYGFKVIDAFSESGIIRETCEPRFLPDGLHPSSDAGISMEGVNAQAALYCSVILKTYLSEEYST